MSNKEKYDRNRPSQVRSREKANAKRKRMNDNLSALEARNRANVYIVPKHSELAPQIADKTILPRHKPLYHKP